MSSRGRFNITVDYTDRGGGMPDPWNGPQPYTTADGATAISSLTLPSAAQILFPVFVTDIRVDIPMINYLLEESWWPMERMFRTALENGEDTERQLVQRLILPNKRNPRYLMAATEPPVTADQIRLPFLGKSLTDVFKAFVGEAEAPGDQSVPFRANPGHEQKCRYWSNRTFLVLDADTMDLPGPPTALVGCLDPASSNIEDLETVRCELPVTLRFMMLIDWGGFHDLKSLKAYTADEQGIIRHDAYEEWFKPGGSADQLWEKHQADNEGKSEMSR